MKWFSRYLSAALIATQLLTPQTVHAALNDVDRQEAVIKNLLAEKNPGFENGKASWTASGGTLSTATSSTNFMGIGRANGTWDSSSASQTLTSAAYTIPNGYAGTNGLMRCKVMTASGTATHTMGVWDGTTLSQTISIPSSTTAKWVEIPFIFGAASSTVAIRFTSVASNEPLISIDDCFIGSNFHLSDIQPITEWATFTPTGSVSTNATYAGVERRVGDTAEYEITVTFSGANTQGAFTVNLPRTIDTAKLTATASGTSVLGTVNYFDANGGGSGRIIGSVIYNTTTTVAVVTMLTATTDTHYLRSTDTSAPSPVTISTGDKIMLRFAVPVSGWTAQSAIRPDQSPSTWSGYHDSTCSWARTNAAYGDPATDASCALVQRQNTNFGTVSGSNSLPSITFTPSKVQKYFVCALVSATIATDAANAALKLWDGTTTIAESGHRAGMANASTTFPLCGIYYATTTASVTLSVQSRASSGAITIQGGNADTGIEWSIFAVDQNMPAPLLVGSVTSNTGGLERIERIVITNSGTPTIASQSGSWVSSLTDNGTGSTTLNIAAGIFSGEPACNCTAVQNGATRTCQINTTKNATAVTVMTGNDTGSLQDANVDVICMGPR